ncbi:MAG: prephenate dehydrogenase [Candidatus Omnitrophota bacterium]|jgi:prephenate dehydrogenase
MKRIKKITILGVGFMGGSLAAAIKNNFPGISVIGYARSKASYSKLIKLEILDRVERDLAKSVEASDIIVLASPIYSIVEHLKKIDPYLKENAIVIDLGSSKEIIEKSVLKYLSKKVSFVGCHPLCGSDKSGAEFFNPNIYKGAVCLVTTPRSKGVEVIKKMWEKLGSRVVFINAKTHDKMLSSTSHLMHLISFSLTGFVPKNYIKFAAASLRDLTRISNSPANVWADIFISNKNNVVRDIDKFVKTLCTFKQLIRKNKKAEIINYIKRINKKHKALALLANKHSI